MATSSFILLQVPMTNVKQESVGKNNEVQFYDTCGDLIVYIVLLYWLLFMKILKFLHELYWLKL